MLELSMSWEHKIRNEKGNEWGETRISKGNRLLNDLFLVRKGLSKCTLVISESAASLLA